VFAPWYNKEGSPMLNDEFTSFVRRTPFQPYRIVMSNGQWYDILHTDFALVGLDSVVVGFSPSQEETKYDSSVLVSFDHVMRIEFIDPDEVAAIKRRNAKK
jgi:hypothetical protein